LAQDKADGGARVLSKETIDAATTKVSNLFGGGYGLGFNLTSSGASVPGQQPGTFGHGGLGGHLSFGDPAAKMGFAYTMNLCVGGARAPGPRLQKLAYECLAKAELVDLAKWAAPPTSAI
jgi:CubicO group peptidase (beta-lactamase class C family)